MNVTLVNTATGVAAAGEQPVVLKAYDSVVNTFLDLGQGLCDGLRCTWLT